MMVNMSRLVLGALAAGFVHTALAADAPLVPLTDEQRKERLMDANPLAGKGAADLPNAVVKSEKSKADAMSGTMAPMDHMLGMTPHDTASPSSQAYIDAHGRMMTDMAIDYSGNADRDFLTGMIPHHQGALDMAKIELKYGKDAEVKKLARAIVAAQEREIALMHKLSKKYDK